MTANNRMVSPRWHCLQHVPFEGPGYLAVWAEERGYRWACSAMWENPALPASGEFDGLIVLGGPMNVYEDAKYPWLAQEKEFIARAISDRKPVLGVCLGAQLLAVVLGGAVTGMFDKEIGWFPVELTRAGRDCSLFRGFPEEFMVFHWHGDAFSIPPQTVHVAQSDACDEQAFVYDDRVVGLQFHLETNEQSIAALIEHCGEDTACGRYTQDPESMTSRADRATEGHVLLARLLDNLAAASAT
ncbi:MAG: amidotransferase [Planctomycetota bacterium]|nr:MAG: amidotransferase [Planctomycetota bacterium]